MKTIKLLLYALPMLFLGSCMTLLTSCQQISLPTPNGVATVKSFGQRTTISEVTYDPAGKGLKVKGYNNNQAEVMAEMFKAGMTAGKAAAGVP